MTDLPMTKADDDLVERLREESLQLARRSFDSVDAGISANLCDRAIDEITRLRSRLSQLQAMRKALDPDNEQTFFKAVNAMRDEHIRLKEFAPITADLMAMLKAALRSLTEGAGKC